MSRRVWIVGPVAWDTVLYIDDYPPVGGYAPGKELIERPGGSAGNVALGLCTSGVETGFVTYLGNDAHGEALERVLRHSEIRHLEIARVQGPSSHVLVVVDGKGNRTIFELNRSHLHEVSLEGVPLEADDIVCFVFWRPHFRESLRLARDAGCTTILGVEALDDEAVEFADVIIGSAEGQAQGRDFSALLHRFPKIVLTQGEQGAICISAAGTAHQPAFPAEVLDTTGAGDAFLAGFLMAYARGLTEGTRALEAGARWAALMVTRPTSIPPPWREVQWG